jgi:hypothetical protein
MDFIDVPGASGTRYRFRRAELHALPPAAGHLIAVTGSPPALRFRLCAAARSLSRSAAEIAAALDGDQGTRLFLRLNVARAARDAEHADIVAAIRPDTELPNLG